jgi:hypothetical protein
MTENAPRRLAELTGGMGQKLEEIKGKPVTVIALTFEVRPVHKLDPKTGAQMEELEDKEVCIITCEGDARYYTFSTPLITKLQEVDPEDLPAIAVFDIKDISGGRRVWTIS